MTRSRRLFRAIYAAFVLFIADVLVGAFLRYVIYKNFPPPLAILLIISFLNAVLMFVIVDQLLEYQYKLDLETRSNIGNRRNGEDRRAKDRRTHQS